MFKKITNWLNEPLPIRPVVGKSPLKPAIKKKLGITYVSKYTRVIEFDTDPSTAQKLYEFGRVDNHSGVYHLEVDGRYDFKEILDYIKSLE